MPNTGLTDIPSPRAKAATILSVRDLAKRLKQKTLDQNVKNWSKAGVKRKNPSLDKLEKVCECIGITREEYYLPPSEFCQAVARECRSEVTADELFEKFNAFQAKLEESVKDVQTGFYEAAFQPIKWTDKARVSALYEKWKGKYHLFHYAPSEPNLGLISRAIVKICGTEQVASHRYMCVSIQWPDHPEYRGIIATGKNRWYFVLGSTSLHETAHMVTFDPAGVGNASKQLHGILLGCTESHPQYPTATNFVMMKVSDDDMGEAKNISIEDPIVTEDIKLNICNAIKPNELTLRAIRPRYIKG